MRVAHDHQVVVALDDEPQQGVLRVTGVLRLVEHHEPIGVLQDAQGRRFGAQELQRQRQHAGVVDRPAFSQVRLVGFSYLLDELLLQAIRVVPR